MNSLFGAFIIPYLLSLVYTFLNYFLGEPDLRKNPVEPNGPTGLDVI